MKNYLKPNFFIVTLLLIFIVYYRLFPSMPLLINCITPLLMCAMAPDGIPFILEIIFNRIHLPQKGPDILSQNDVSYQKKSVSKIKVAKPVRTRIYSTKLLKKKHILKVKYKKVSNITGYEIQYSKNPKFKNKKIIYSKKSFITINSRKNSTYYIRVRTYNSVLSKNYQV